MEHVITAVRSDSIAFALGLRPGDALEKINGEEIQDQIDYQALTALSTLDLSVRMGGKRETLCIEKDEDEPLGLSFGASMELCARPCRNRCVFCFIDQMPHGLRRSLYVKDDDWRMSLMMGNYITLTNVDDAEFDRILRRRASPLYISVHATDPDLRVRMMRNPRAAELPVRLSALRDAGLRFHAQIVLCPGLNDGAALQKTMDDLLTYLPAFQSAALVPVGLTRHRDGLEELLPFRPDSAVRVLDMADAMRAHCLRRYGSRLFYPSDELYCLAGREPPPDEAYEDYPQIENGVGLIRTLEEEIRQARDEWGRAEQPNPKRILLVTGASAAPLIRTWIAQYGDPRVNCRVKPIRNDFFGATVTVAGLITGRDIVAQTKDEACDELVFSSVMLRAEGDRFLDDMTLDELRAALPFPCRPIGTDGEALYRVIAGFQPGR